MLGLALLAGGALAHIPVVYLAGPSDDWCGVINGTIGNDIVLLYPGEYVGPCDVRADLSDIPAEQTTIGSFDPLDPATFVGSTGDAVLRVSGERLMLLEVAFRDLPEGVVGVAVDDIRELWLKRVSFDGATRALLQRGTAEELRVLETEFLGVSRPLDIGCGGACPVPLVEIAASRVSGGDEALTIGDGSIGTVTDNVMTAMTAGVSVGAGIALEGNLIAATGPALAVRSSPLQAEANVLLGDPAVSAPGGSVAILGSTLVGPLALTSWGPGDRFVGNAVLGVLPDLGGAEIAGSVACDDACFTDAAGWDFYPAPSSPLRGAGAALLGDDWCGRARAETPTSGALEAEGDRSFGPLRDAFKDDIDCTLPETTAPPETADTADTAAPPTTDAASPDRAPLATPDDAKAPAGCCSTAGGGGEWAYVALAIWLRRRTSAHGQSPPYCA